MQRDFGDAIAARRGRRARWFGVLVAMDALRAAAVAALALALVGGLVSGRAVGPDLALRVGVPLSLAPAALELPRWGFR